MKWEKDAQNKIKKVPFFLKKRVKGIIEKQAEKEGMAVITVEAVENARTYFLDTSEKNNESLNEGEVSLYSVAVCKGESKKCPYMVSSAKGISNRIYDLFMKLDFNKRRMAAIDGMILPHQKLKISISTCPNGCSQPQIADIGIIVQLKPTEGQGKCSSCMQCVKACKEDAIEIIKKDNTFHPVFDYNKCMYCSVCVITCQTRAIETEKVGYKLLAGGKLGRHPVLAKEILAWCTEDELIKKIEELVTLFLEKASQESKMAHLIHR